MNKLKLSGVVKESTVDGPGLRYTIFAQGCPHECKGCHNPDSHDFDGGYEQDIASLAKDIKKNKYLSGITLSGGEPFCQAAAFCTLCDILPGIQVIVYSGYTFDEIIANEDFMPLLLKTDILIDGRYEEETKNPLLIFRGSENQRVIDVKQSLLQNKIIEIEF